MEYHQLAGVCMDKPCILLNIPFFEDVLNVNVVVFAAHLHNQVIYPDIDSPQRNHIYITYITQKREMVWDTLTVLPK